MKSDYSVDESTLDCPAKVISLVEQQDRGNLGPFVEQSCLSPGPAANSV